MMNPRPLCQLGMQFTTLDADHDLCGNDASDSCAVIFHGAWWYDCCHRSNLNGLYNSTAFGVGLNWYSWRGYYYSVKTTVMMMRDVN